MSQHIVVTGSAGRIGRSAVRALVGAGHRVTGFDRVPTPGLPGEQSVVADIGDAAALLAATRGADCVVHLAAAPDDARFPRGAPPDDGDNFLSQLVPANLVGSYQVMEAVRKNGVRRAVLASSVQVVDGHIAAADAGHGPVPVDALPRPRYLYACTKVFLEALGQVYAAQHGVEVLAVRLGWCPRDVGQVAEIKSLPVYQNLYFSPGDVGRFFAAAVSAPVAGFHTVYAASRPVAMPQFDLGPTTALTGYHPQDVWPVGAEEFG